MSVNGMLHNARQTASFSEVDFASAVEELDDVQDKHACKQLVWIHMSDIRCTDAAHDKGGHLCLTDVLANVLQAPVTCAVVINNKSNANNCGLEHGSVSIVVRSINA